MVSYKTQLIFLFSLTYPSIIQANHGTLSPSLEYPSQRLDTLFRRNMAKQTMTQEANRHHSRQLTPYKTIHDNESNRPERNVLISGQTLFHQPLQQIQPYRRIRHYTISKWEDLVKLLQALRRKCSTNTRARDTPSITSPREDGRLWTSTRSRDAPSITSARKDGKLWISTRSRDTRSVTSPREDGRSWTSTRSRDAPSITSAREDGRWWAREIKRSSVDIDRHIEVTNQRLFMLRKRPSGLAPPARDWCRLIGYSVCPRGAGT